MSKLPKLKISKKSRFGSLIVISVLVLAVGLIAFNSTNQAKAASITFGYTGSPTSWVVPTGVTSITIVVAGAQGGEGSAASGQYTTDSGYGGLVTATLAVTPGTTYYMNVGGQGGTGVPVGTAGTAGYGGGGAGGSDGSYYTSGGGGGMTWFGTASTFSQGTSIVVAGGGGGGAWNSQTNHQWGGGGGTTPAGGIQGVSGTSSGYGNAGGGATLSAGGSGGATNGATGSAGQGGAGGAGEGAYNNAGGGGGGGYYGGGGGGSSTTSYAGGGTGGGGSSYASGSATSVTLAQGVNTGNGSVTIYYNSSGIAVANLSYTGSVQSWVVPTGVTSINLIANGAGGGGNVYFGGLTGGTGGLAAGTLSVTPGTTYYYSVGGAGGQANTGSGGGGTAGYGGGGTGGYQTCCGNDYGGGGGGGMTWFGTANTFSQGTAILVAGGGGGDPGGWSYDTVWPGAAGGGTSGQAGMSFGLVTGGGGGTQSAGGTAGTGDSSNNGTAGGVAVGGNGGNGTYYGGGGGGGGYYGGGGAGGGSNNNGVGAGGGGSSYLSSSLTNTFNIQGAGSAGQTNGSLTIAYSTSTPTVTAISPTTGANTGSISISSISGTNFVSGATVALTMSGQSNINCTGFTFTNSTTLSSGSCPITGAVAGAWNVVVTNPSMQTGTLASGFTVTSSGGGASWLSSGWNYRKMINITGQTGAGPNYQIKLLVGESSGSSGASFNIGGHSASFPTAINVGGDFQFTASDGQTVLPFWVETVTGSSPNRVATVWVNVSADLGSNQSIYLYYGNSSATNASNGTNTFLIFDNFPGTSINTGTWFFQTYTNGGVATGNDGGVAVSGNQLTITNVNTDYSHVIAANTFLPASGYAVESLMYDSNGSSSGQNYAWCYIASNVSTSTIRSEGGSWLYANMDDTDAYSGDGVQYTDSGQNWLGYAYSGSSMNSAAVGSIGNWWNTWKRVSWGVVANTGYMKYTRVRQSDGATETISGTSSYTTPTSQRFYLDIGNYGWWTTQYAIFDWVAIRKYQQNEPSFSTAGSEQTQPSSPTVTSPTSSSITYNSAVLGANVTSNGGSSLTAIGICWGTSPAPRSNCSPQGGTSTGVFTMPFNSLPSNTLIYYAGYATNASATGYSSDGTFTTSAPGAPTVTSPTATSITSVTAILGANVTSNGGGSITAVGTCWGTSLATVTSTCSIDNGDTSTGVYTMQVTGLTASSTIYYEGYATNSSGTGYSAYSTFSTLSLLAENGSLVSGVFDTGYPNGVQFNSIMWQGTQGIGSSSVQFQFAAANCANGSLNYPSCSSATGTIAGSIDPVNYWAWNDTLGWLNFSTAAVATTSLNHWATVQSTGDYIALDCATLPPGGTNNCAADGNFTVSDNSNNLAGFAWNDTYGWISFCGNSSGGASTWNGTNWVCPSSPTYEVTVNASTGQFSGWAWNDILGWISFNCSNTTSCGSSNYYVQVDVGSSSWSFIGPDGTSNTYYTAAGPNTPVPLVGVNYNNDRYYRYKLFLSKSAGATSPIINNIVVNWSP